jgi:hypothetical protein
MDKELVRFKTGGDHSVLVEVTEADAGFVPASRTGDLITEARETFDQALAEVEEAASRALRSFRDGPLRPDGVEITFGVRFNAKVGAVIASTAAEGHLSVRLTWAPNGALPVPAAGDAAPPAIDDGDDPSR